VRLGTARRAALEFTVESVSVSFASAVDELVAALSGRVVVPAREVTTATPAVSRQTAAICTQMHSALDRTRRRSNQVDNTCDNRRPTDDLGQFITLSVHLCLQHDAHEAARRAGPSATADIVYFRVSQN